MNPSTSLIICTYMREEPLCNLLTTVLEQTIKDFEILLVDQTPKHTPQTVAFLESHSDRIRIIRQETPNLPMARNTGIRQAKGEYIVFADDDLKLPGDCLKVLVNRLQESEYAGVTGLVNPGLPVQENWEQYLRNHGYSLDRRRDEGVIQVDVFIGALMAFRREVFAEVGFFDEAFGVVNPTCAGEDIDFCRRIRSHGLKLAVEPIVEIEHEMNHAGGCGARKGDRLRKLRQIMRANLYMAFKHSRNSPRIDVLNWQRVIRADVLNRAILKMGPGEVYCRIQLLRSEYRDVKRIFCEQSKPIHLINASADNDRQVALRPSDTTDS